MFSLATLVASTKYLLSQITYFLPRAGEKIMASLHKTTKPAAGQVLFYVLCAEEESLSLHEQYRLSLLFLKSQ